MDRIEKYINSIYRDVNDTSKETQDLKQEMRGHLIQTVSELMKSGLTEDESIKIAIERFGGEFQIRNELTQVVKFQKYFAKSILIASLILLLGCITVLTISHFVQKEFIKRETIMNTQVHLIEAAFKDDGIDGVDECFKGILQDVKNNQLTYVAIKQLPKNFDINDHKVNVFTLGETKYSYPPKITNKYYGNTFGNIININNTTFLIQTGIKTSSNTDPRTIYVGITVLMFAICWVLWIIWSIINIYRIGKLNIWWCILLILTSIIGYFIFLIFQRFYNGRTINTL